MKRMLRAMIVGASAAPLFDAGTALASQGPGVTPGTASASLQLAMGIVVYGGSALLVVAGLIGTARHR